MTAMREPASPCVRRSCPVAQSAQVYVLTTGPGPCASSQDESWCAWMTFTWMLSSRSALGATSSVPADGKPSQNAHDGTISSEWSSVTPSDIRFLRGEYEAAGRNAGRAPTEAKLFTCTAISPSPAAVRSRQSGVAETVEDPFRMPEFGLSFMEADRIPIQRANAQGAVWVRRDCRP